MLGRPAMCAAQFATSLEPASSYVSIMDCESLGELGGHSNSSMEIFLGVFPLAKE